MVKTISADPIWEHKYSRGYATRYPWDFVVTFLFTHNPQSKKRGDTKVLEVGCGTGNNLWCAAREGFRVAGIDASESAVAYARNRFEEDGLDGEFRVGDFTNLPFGDNCFDMAIDRAAITCCGNSSAEKAVAEVRRTLVPGGKFIFNCYSDQHSSYIAGEPGADGVRVNISAGTLVNEGQIYMYGRREIDELFADGWCIIGLEHMERSERTSPNYSVHAEWRVVLEKVA